MEYPTEEELQKIREWEYNDLYALFLFIKDIWNWGDDYVTIKGDPEVTITLVTGGWSGNEEIIQALSENYIVWAQCWEKSERGGLYEFKFKKVK